MIVRDSTIINSQGIERGILTMGYTLSRGDILKGMEDGKYKSGDRFKSGTGSTLFVAEDGFLMIEGEGRRTEHEVRCLNTPIRYYQIIEPKFKVGDYVVCSNKIAKVTRIDGYKVYGFWYSEDSGINNGTFEDWFNAGNCQPATAERIQREERRQEFAKFGRKRGEFKNGDIIEVLNTGTSDLLVGEIGRLGDERSCGTRFRVEGRLQSVNWLEVENMKLIAVTEGN